MLNAKITFVLTRRFQGSAGYSYEEEGNRQSGRTLSPQPPKCKAQPAAAAHPQQDIGEISFLFYFHDDR
jgi:hypothetical protein